MFEGKLIKSALAAVTIVCLSASSALALDHAKSHKKEKCAAQAGASTATGGEAAKPADAGTGAEAKSATASDTGVAKPKRKHHRRHNRRHRRARRNRNSNAVYNGGTTSGRYEAPAADQMSGSAPAAAPARRTEVKEHSTNDLTSSERGWKHKTAAEATVTQ